MLCHINIQISSSLVLIHWFFTKLWPLDLHVEKHHELSVFCTFSVRAFRYLVYCFAIPRCRSSWSLVLIHWFFTKLWPIDLKKYHKLSVCHTFFVPAFRYIHLIFGILLCHTKIQIMIELGFDPLISHEVMALGLRRKLSRIISFPHCFCSCLQISIWYLVHCFAIPRYRSSSSLVLIHWFFTKLWP
jgi:hypothetical protein